MTHNDIDPLCKAIYEQCGMRATVHKTWDQWGPEVEVMVCLVSPTISANHNDWAFFRAMKEDGLPGLRDELTDFIAAHRKQEVA